MAKRKTTVAYIVEQHPKAKKEILINLEDATVRDTAFKVLHLQYPSDESVATLLAYAKKLKALERGAKNQLQYIVRECNKTKRRARGAMRVEITKYRKLRKSFEEKFAEKAFEHMIAPRDNKPAGETP